MAVLLIMAYPACADAAAAVPPTLEIEVLDPNADPLGNPAIELQPSRCWDGTLEVDIPPVVVVHRYYYTGNRSFQGPMLPGGPSIVVCHHPKTGERCYIPVQMLPGAPVVHYTGHGIEYDYGKHGISVKFGLFGKPNVVYRNCTPATRVAKNVLVGAAEGTANLIEESGLPKATAVATQGAKNLAVSARDGVVKVGGAVLSPAVQLINATPLGSVFQTSPEEIAQRRRDREVRCAAIEASRADASIATLR